jgi:hypothetical protein
MPRGGIVKKTNQLSKWFKTKQIAIQRISIKFEKKIQKSTRDVIKNKIQLETINVNKKTTNKRRDTASKEKISWRASMIFCMASTQSYEEIKGKERGKKSFSTKPCRTTIYAPSRKEENTETNQMMRRKCHYNDWSHPHVLSKVDELSCWHVLCTHQQLFFNYLYKIKNAQNQSTITNKP